MMLNTSIPRDGWRGLAIDFTALVGGLRALGKLAAELGTAYTLDVPRGMERKNSQRTRSPYPSVAAFFRPDIQLWPGGRRIQDPQGKEVRLAFSRFLTSRPPCHMRVRTHRQDVHKRLRTERCMDTSVQTGALAPVILLPTAASTPVFNLPRRGRYPANVHRMRCQVWGGDSAVVTHGVNVGRVVVVLSIRRQMAFIRACVGFLVVLDHSAGTFSSERDGCIRVAHLRRTLDVAESRAPESQMRDAVVRGAAR